MMEKYGTDMLANLIEAETKIMRDIASEMSKTEKTASKISKLDLELQQVRAQIDEARREQKTT